MKRIYFLLPMIFLLLGAGCVKTEQAPVAQKVEKNITIQSPAAGQAVGFPFTIKGMARVFENTFNIRIKDSAGNILYEDIVMSDAEDAGLFGNYEVKINYFLKQPADNNLALEVFDYSAKDGSVQDLVSVPIMINTGDIQTVKLYFSNNNLDPKISCDKVFPVTRIVPAQQSIGTAALDLLLKGPSAEEYNAGYYTSINSGAKLQKLTISNGIATADFGEQLQSGIAGSCKVAAIRAEITQTLKQFSSVKSVVISINGNSQGILQP